MSTPPRKQKTYILGVGLTPFIKPRQLRTYADLGFEAGTKALLDAGITYDSIQTGVACYCYGDTTCGQRVFYQFGMTGIPVYNVNNACATGSTGLALARTLTASGAADCVLVIGFETMKPGAIKSIWNDRPSPMGLSTRLMEELNGKDEKSPRNAQYFGNAGREYMQKHGAKAEDFAEIARVSHEHSQRNPYAQFRTKYSLGEIMDSTMIYEPLTKLQCSPTSDGAGAAVVVSETFLSTHPHLRKNAIEIAGQSLQTDQPALYTSRSSISLVGYDMTVRAVRAALSEAGLPSRPLNHIKVCELHDCFSANELLLLDALGFSDPGKAHEMVRDGRITYAREGGKGGAKKDGVVVNPSGGLISKGHPLGATGLAQCAELVWQLRGWATNRLVGGVDVALQHNLGLGGAVVVSVYRRADGRSNDEVVTKEDEIARESGLGYNPAVEARGVTKEMAEKVRSRKARCDEALGELRERVGAKL